MIINKILKIIDKDLSKLPFLVFIFIFGACLDFFGIMLIFPLFEIYSSTSDSVNIYSYQLTYIDYFSDKKTFFIFALVLLYIIFAIKAFSGVYINYIIYSFSNKMIVNIRSKLFFSIQSVDYEKFTNKSSSEYIYAINTLTSLFGGKVIINILKAISDMFITFALLIALLISATTEIILLLIMIISSFFIYDKIIRKNMKIFGKNANYHASKLIQVLNDSILGFKEINVLGKNKYFNDKFIHDCKRYSANQTKYSVLSSVPRYYFELVIISFIISIFLYQIYLNNDFNSKLPVITALAFASVRILPAITSITNAVSSLRYNVDTIDRLFDESQNQSPFNKIVVKNSSGIIFKNLTLSNVSFKYKNNLDYTLKSINFSISTGQMVGILGESGSGKSTLINLLLGFLKPQIGDCFINESKISLSSRCWIDQVAYLPQETFISDSSLHDNIVLNDISNTNLQHLEKTLHMSNLDGVVNTLPNGIDSKLGERGMLLSGGQRQRVSLARAFYHQKNFLIFDESTSALDGSTEDKILNEIKSLKGIKTILLISHNLRTFRHCDVVFRMHDGVLQKTTFQSNTNILSS